MAAYRDDAGLPYVYGACKLLNLLGYGSMIDKSNTGKAAITQKYLGLENLGDGDNPLVYSVSQTVNMLPIFAYQKIYFDFFSNSQWEKHLAYSYNVDYWQGNSYITLYSDMLKMRYANYPKDYFMGVLPNSQYGPVAVMYGVRNPQYDGSALVAAGGSAPRVVNPSGSSVGLASAGPGSNTPVDLNSTSPPFQSVQLNTCSVGKK